MPGAGEGWGSEVDRSGEVHEVDYGQVRLGQVDYGYVSESGEVGSVVRSLGH